MKLNKLKSTCRYVVLKEAGGDDATVKSVLDVLFGDHLWDDYTEYVIYKYDNTKPNTTMLQRINRFWIYPLYVITIPFQYIVRGKHGFTKASRFQRLLISMIGED